MQHHWRYCTEPNVMARVVSPYVSKIEALWRTMRSDVLEIFPGAPGIPSDIKGYIEKVDEIYVTEIS